MRRKKKRHSGSLNEVDVNLITGSGKTVFTCPHTIKFRTRPIAGTVSGITGPYPPGEEGRCSPDFLRFN